MAIFEITDHLDQPLPQSYLPRSQRQLLFFGEGVFGHLYRLPRPVYWCAQNESNLARVFPAPGCISPELEIHDGHLKAGFSASFNDSYDLQLHCY
jgi:hypothetical protein